MSKVISETQDNCGRPNLERNRWPRLQAEGGLRGPQGVLMAHREKSLLHLFGFFFFFLNSVLLTPTSRYTEKLIWEGS